jgi:hypothetical protein
VDAEVISATVLLLVTSANNTYPQSAFLLLDGNHLWSGAMSEPDSDLYYADVPFSILQVVHQNLARGSHTLTFGINDQPKSPTAYTIGGRVELRWNGPFSPQRIALAETQVLLDTGQDWTMPFTVPAPPPL